MMATVCTVVEKAAVHNSSLWRPSSAPKKNLPTISVPPKGQDPLLPCQGP